MADTKWIAATGGEWNTAGNWDNGVPDSTKNAIFDAASLSQNSTVTITTTAASCLNLDFSALDCVLTLQSAIVGLNIHGNLTEHASNIIYTFTGTSYIYFKGDSLITTNGKVSHTWNKMYIDATGKTVTLNDDLNLGSTDFYFTAGTLVQGINKLVLNPTGLTNRVFSGNGKTFGKVHFSGTHTGYFDITGANTFAEIIIDKGRKVRPINGVTQQVGKLTAIGTQAEPITITSPTAAIHTLNYTGTEEIQADWLYLHYSKVTPANKWYAGNGSAYLPTMGNGLLYNWYAVSDAHGLAPAGCHIPSSAEWTTLSNYLGGDTVSGGKLKSINPIFWNNGNLADNSSGFTYFGNGFRKADGVFISLKEFGILYHATTNSYKAFYFNYVATGGTGTTGFAADNKIGAGVRCIVDTIPTNGIITDVDGNRYGIVTIGTQTWLTSNLKTTKYADGTAIPNVTDNSAWAALTTGAYCSYNNAAIVEYPSNNDGWVMRNVSKGMMNFF